MANYSFTRKAVEDLSDIWNYTDDNWSEKKADLYYQILLNNCQDIAENRVIGKNYEEIIRNMHDEAWWDDFYTPMENLIKELRDKYANDAEASAILDQLAAEPDIHRRYSDFYAYEFFVARRPFSRLHHTMMEMNEQDTPAAAD